jgi:hypothetical protein
MSGERFDYSSERQRHETFVGREGLLSRLDQLLVDSDTDRWIVVTGGPGMGKSALLAAWLARRDAAGAVVVHHFIRRGEYDWDDPAKLVGSLVAQLEERFPDVREPDANARMHPASRLAGTLSRVAEQAAVGLERERHRSSAAGSGGSNVPACSIHGHAREPLTRPRSRRSLRQRDRVCDDGRRAARRLGIG